MKYIIQNSKWWPSSGIGTLHCPAEFSPYALTVPLAKSNTIWSSPAAPAIHFSFWSTSSGIKNLRCLVSMTVTHPFDLMIPAKWPPAKTSVTVGSSVPLRMSRWWMWLLWFCDMTITSCCSDSATVSVSPAAILMKAPFGLSQTKVTPNKTYKSCDFKWLRSFLQGAGYFSTPELINQQIND